MTSFFFSLFQYSMDEKSRVNNKANVGELCVSPSTLEHSSFKLLFCVKLCQVACLKQMMANKSAVMPYVNDIIFFFAVDSCNRIEKKKKILKYAWKSFVINFVSVHELTNKIFMQENDVDRKEQQTTLRDFFQSGSGAAAREDDKKLINLSSLGKGKSNNFLATRLIGWI
jgi:hypothetical protein